MMKIQTPAEIAKMWRQEGRTFRIGDAIAEFERQGEAARIAREDEILTHPENYSADLVGSIRDHRAARAAERGPIHWGDGDTSGIGLN